MGLKGTETTRKGGIRVSGKKKSWKGGIKDLLKKNLAALVGVKGR